MIYLVIWWLVGTAGFVFWWTKDHDLTVSSFLLCIISGGICGPISWVIGFLIYGDYKMPNFGRNKIILKRRS